MTLHDTPLDEVCKLLGKPTANRLMERPYWQQETALRGVRGFVATLEFYGVVLNPIDLDERLDRLVRRILDGFDYAAGHRPA